MSANDNGLEFLDIITIFSVMLQVVGYKNDISQSSNDDLMRELQKQDKRYLDRIIEIQNKIIEKLADLGWYILWDRSIGLSHIDFKEV